MQDDPLSSGMNKVTVRLPDRLIQGLDALVEQGLYADRCEAVRDAVRDLVEKKHLHRLEQAVDEDIGWALGQG